jgi:hypothetical protein
MESYEKQETYASRVCLKQSELEKNRSLLRWLIGSYFNLIGVLPMIWNKIETPKATKKSSCPHFEKRGVTLRPLEFGVFKVEK